MRLTKLPKYSPRIFRERRLAPTSCRTKSSKGRVGALRRSDAVAQRPYQTTACKFAGMVFIRFSAASFVITPLVPGSPSLDVRPHSPGGTRRKEDSRL